jgi:hypothetical protein
MNTIITFADGTEATLSQLQADVTAAEAQFGHREFCFDHITVGGLITALGEALSKLQKLEALIETEPVFHTDDAELDELLCETVNLHRGPEFNNMDTALMWQSCLEKIKQRLLPVEFDSNKMVGELISETERVIQQRDAVLHSRVSTSSQVDSHDPRFGWIVSRHLKRPVSPKFPEGASPAYNPSGASADQLLQAVQRVIADHHFALDCEEPAEAAQTRAITTISNLMGVPWDPGAELARRQEREAAMQHLPDRL